MISVVLELALCFSGAALADETVTSCGSAPNLVFQFSTVYQFNLVDQCPGGALQITTQSDWNSQGQGAIWQAVAPPGMLIVGASVQLLAAGVNASGGQYGGDFYWQGGTWNIPNKVDRQFSLGPFSSSDFGFLVVCGKPTCSPSGVQGVVEAGPIVLSVRETSGPWLSAPAGLWQAQGWIRGTWNVGFSGDSPSGLCGLVADFGTQSLPGTTSARNPATWHQCAAGPVNDPVATQSFPDGAERIHIGAWDAAGETVDYFQTVYVDNQQPTVSLSGPADAPSTAGTQYVTATASAGPSGIDGIACSVDGAPAQWYAGASAQVPVGGIGEHQIQCEAANNAVDPAGTLGWSAPATATMKIGDPTVSAITFGHIIDALRCKHVTERVKVPARWVTVRRHHKRIKIKRRARSMTKTVTKCHPRTKLKRVAERVAVHRHGKTVWITRHKRERVVLLPHVKNSAKLRVKHGQSATVSGWLGTDTGEALAGQSVQVRTAPDNGLQHFKTAAKTTTAANGTWNATLPAGPSRLVEAVYRGGPTTQASISGQVKLIVPAKIKLLSVAPRQVAWGGTVWLVGKLQGGYLPAAGALVRLRIGEGSAKTTYGIKEHVAGDGRFTTTYTFGAGVTSVHRVFWFQLASLPTGDYPYAPASSRRLSVIVGGHPRSR